MLILIFEPICTFYEISASAMRGLGYSAVSAAVLISYFFIRRKMLAE